MHVWQARGLGIGAVRITNAKTSRLMLRDGGEYLIMRDSIFLHGVLMRSHFLLLSIVDWLSSLFY